MNVCFLLAYSFMTVGAVVLALGIEMLFYHKRLWKKGYQRPADGQFVCYHFEPFDRYYCGLYQSETDSVSGKHGFTSWEPEVLRWYPLPEPIFYS